MLFDFCSYQLPQAEHRNSFSINMQDANFCSANVNTTHCSQLTLLHMDLKRDNQINSSTRQLWELFQPSFSASTLPDTASSFVLCACADSDAVLLPSLPLTLKDAPVCPREAAEAFFLIVHI